MCSNNTLLHKPGSKDKAIESLKLLANQKHFNFVVECVYIKIMNAYGSIQTVKLKMHDLTEKEIINYVDIENPIDWEHTNLNHWI